jgi:hypothetical protein
MKKLFLLLFLVSMSGFSQKDLSYRFPELLVGKKIRITKDDDYLKKSGYYNFYKKQDLRYNSKINASFENYYNLDFTLISISDKDNLERQTLELKNDKLGTIYYQYTNHLGGSGWIFSPVEELIIPDDYLCKYIVTETDKFTGKTSSKTTSSEYIQLYKEDGRIMLYLQTPGSTLNIGKTGIIILLADGSKIENNTALIEAKASRYSGYDYSVLFSLKPDEIEKLKKSYITDYRLYVYDFQPHEPLFIQKEFNCILKNIN